jgi:alkylation response protein AidB-like acyl-CoA dehydrogenase
MDFRITEEQQLLLHSVDRFFKRHLPLEEVRRRDHDHEPPYHLLPLMGELGILGLPLPKEFGGFEERWETVALIQERMGYLAQMAASLYNRIVSFGGMSLLTYGTAQQKAKLLPALIRGELLPALALTEPEAGSDAAAVRTRAHRVDGGWVLNGRKSWVSDADAAQYIVTACRTDPESRGAAGISMFLVPRAAPGLFMTRLPKVGNNCLPSWDVAYEDTFVSDEALMGEEHRGFKHLMSTLHYARASLASSVIGQSQAAVDLALAYAKERQQFGQPIGKFQVIQHRLVDMQTRVDLCRLMIQYLAWRISENLPSRKEAAQAKVTATECLQFVTDHGMQIMASAGYSTDGDMQRYWRDGRLYSFGEGSNEIQRNIIARDMGL